MWRAALAHSVNECGKLTEKNKRGCKYIEQQDGAAHIFASRKLCKYFVCYRILTEIAIDFFLGISDWISLNVKLFFWLQSDGYFIMSSLPLFFCIFFPYTHSSAIIKQSSFVEKSQLLQKIRHSLLCRSNMVYFR